MGWLLRLTSAICVTASVVFVASGEVPRQIDTEEFAGGLYRSGDLFVSGQPLSVSALQSMKAQGVTTVINLRTPEEMSSQGTLSREPDIVKELGMTYVAIPTGGADYPYTPEAVKQFSQAVAESPGSVLLHCASGRRASHLWVAYLVREKGLTLDEAVKRGKQANFGEQPYEGFLAEEVEHRVKGVTAPD